MPQANPAIALETQEELFADAGLSWLVSAWRRMVFLEASNSFREMEFDARSYPQGLQLHEILSHPSINKSVLSDSTAYAQCLLPLAKSPIIIFD
jgi:hypothetical protein